jgi:hypothetical protein
VHAAKTVSACREIVHVPVRGLLRGAERINSTILFEALELAI